jgi:hypothetical protein
MEMIAQCFDVFGHTDLTASSLVTASFGTVCLLRENRVNLLQRYSVAALGIFLTAIPAFSQPQASAHVTNVFSEGYMLRDTNHDGVIDFIEGKVVVPAQPDAAENAAAANIAARLGFASTGLTPPLVVSAAAQSAPGPRIWIGEHSVPPALSANAAQLLTRLQPGEGGVFALAGGLLIAGKNEAGLTAAANAFSARAPYLWKVPGAQFDGISEELNRIVPGANAHITGVTYTKGHSGVSRLLVSSHAAVIDANLKAILNLPRFAFVHELVVTAAGHSISALNPKPLPIAPSAPEAAPTTGAGDDAATPQPLDLSLLYTSKGLFKGTAKMPIPSSLDAQLSVPAGAAGIAMANLAARMGLETTGLSLPLAKPAAGELAKDIHTKAVVAASTPAGQSVIQKLQAEDTAGQALPSLAPGEGELRIVDRAFGKQSAVLVRGDESGSTAALQILSDRMPSLWETGKQYASLEELRYDLHRFFSLRSPAGQAAVALYHLKKWTDEINHESTGLVRDVKAEVYVDVADDRLQAFVKKQLETELKVETAGVKAASLHAGTQCCSENPQLHYEQPGLTFQQGAPTFTQDIAIPWEGTRLVNLVENSLHDLKPGHPVKLTARVSEGPEVRRRLQTQLASLLTQHGIPPDRLEVQILCSFKQGYSWLLDEVAPKLQGKSAARIKIEFAKDTDPSGVRLMYSPARWVQELYPVDEMLAKALNIPLKSVELAQFDPQPASPTYRVHAYDVAGKEVFTSEFTVSTSMRPYNGVIPSYEQVQVETGWVNLNAGDSVLLNQRIETDIETFWQKYQDETLPKLYQFIMAQAHGHIRPEFAPPFDTLRLDIHMSEPDYAIGLDKERISTLEAIQEDTFYSTENFINMLTSLESGHPETYAGRIIPVVHGSEDGKDGHVHIEFFGKPAANPLVRLSWTDAKGEQHEKQRDIAVLGGAMQPRLIRARMQAGQSSLEDLTWILPADYQNDDYEEWIKLEPEEQVDRSLFSIAQAKGQIDWLQQMHNAGLYRDELAYPHLNHLGMEFELPVPLTAKTESPAPRSYVSWNVTAPATQRPLIDQITSAKSDNAIVQWDEPISPAENTEVLSKLAKFEGVNVYWMGRSYLGRDIWAADMTTPFRAQLRSWPKETTLKASILYSGRQHANEVSSTSHVDKLGELLVTDPATRAMLKQVNVVLHPIDNPDGAQLSVVLAKITPDNLLHPGYHGSLAADVANGQAESDPVYPESRTRRQLLESWLPDGFLNPHGYPSHEWVQPFSEYTAWVQTREGANPGRAWWIPRGWFTSLNYIRDADHPYSEKLTYELRDRIVEAERNVPGLLDLETRMNDRYQRFGQRWQPQDMTQPIVNGIRIYMSLKGNPARAAADSTRSATGGVSPDITWDSGYTEAPDETAHGDYMKLMASAGLAFDRVHLSYFANGNLRIRRTQKESGDKVVWQVIRDRPNLPVSELPPVNAKPGKIE